MSAYSAAIMALTPEAYLRLGESSGTTATDISGNGHHGTYHGSPTLGVAGGCGDFDTAVSLGGAGQYVTVPVPLNTIFGSPGAGGALTLIFWLKVPTYANDNGAAVIYGTDWYNDSIYCLPNYSDGKFMRGISSSAPFSQQTFDSVTRPSAGDWHHIMLTTEATGGGTTKSYVDCAASGTPSNGLAGAWHRSDKDFYLGHNGTDGVDLTCSIDEFAVITRVISAAERDSICVAIQETNPYWGVKAH